MADKLQIMRDRFSLLLSDLSPVIATTGQGTTALWFVSIPRSQGNKGNRNLHARANRY